MKYGASLNKMLETDAKAIHFLISREDRPHVRASEHHVRARSSSSIIIAHTAREFVGRMEWGDG
jgi:hypothetical protein